MKKAQLIGSGIFNHELFGLKVEITGDFERGAKKTHDCPEQYPEFCVTHIEHKGEQFDLDEIPQEVIEDIETRFLAGEFCDPEADNELRG